MWLILEVCADRLKNAQVRKYRLLTCLSSLPFYPPSITYGKEGGKVVHSHFNEMHSFPY